jgi:hypothetical protein
VTVTRTHRETALVLMAILGGAAWLFLPLALVVKSERIAAVALTAGGAMGAACATTLLPRLSPVTAAIAGALAAFTLLGTESLGSHDSATIDTRALQTAAFTAGAAGCATVLLRLMSVRAALTVTGAALVSLAGAVAVVMAAVIAVELLDATPLAIAGAVFFGPFAGGMVAVVLVPGADLGHVARGWPLLCLLTTAALGIAAATPLVIGPGLLSLFILCPILSGLGALGAWVARPRQPLGGSCSTSTLPPARTHR